MTNKETYRGYLQQLQKIYSANEATVITDWVFESVAGLHRSDIIKNPGQPIIPEASILLKDCLGALLQHKPVQYVLGEAWFYKMKFKVNEQVLIPRPETEELVQLVAEDWKPTKGRQELSGENQIQGSGRKLTMLDIGTGSGCIAITIKKKLPEIMIHAIDVSPGALSVAKENAKNHQTEIRFLRMDFLNEDNWKSLPVFDIISSNPPYIPLKEKDKLDKNVTAFEPHTALFVPDDTALLFYEKIAVFGKTHLGRNGKIYVEIHEDFAKETLKVFEQFYTVEIKKDIFGKERMLTAAITLPD